MHAQPLVIRNFYSNKDYQFFSSTKELAVDESSKSREPKRVTKSKHPQIGKHLAKRQRVQPERDLHQSDTMWPKPYFTDRTLQEDWAHQSINRAQILAQKIKSNDSRNLHKFELCHQGQMAKEPIQMAHDKRIKASLDRRVERPLKWAQPNGFMKHELSDKQHDDHLKPVTHRGGWFQSHSNHIQKEDNFIHRRMSAHRH